MARFTSNDAGGLVRRARLDVGMTQSELAERAELRQPSLAQIESGTRRVSAEMLERVLRAADYRPSLALVDHADAILEAAARRGLRRVRVFGSTVRGEDGYDSDIDLLVSADADVDLFDVGLFAEQVRLLTGFHTDVVVDAVRSPVVEAAEREAVTL